MRQVELMMVKALKLRTPMKSGNTQVIQYDGDVATVELHGNLIAYVDYTHQSIILRSAGWRSNTTKSRLNSLASGFNLCGIYQKDGVWYWADGSGREYWDSAEFPLNNESMVNLATPVTLNVAA